MMGLAERLAVRQPGTLEGGRLVRPGASARADARRIARSTTAKVLAIAIALLLWQLVVASGWKPSYVLPPPATVFGELWARLLAGDVLPAVWLTLQRAAAGFSIAIVLGGLLGIAVSRWSLLRAAVGSLITGLQTMPSIAWFPFAILLFGLSEQAILFVVILGAAPAIANGIIAGVDHVPPLLIRAGRVLGATGISAYRHVIVPAALPSIVAGTKQGWAFAWRSLLAGELLVVIPGQLSVGAQLQFARELSDMPWLLSTMLVILALGLFVDGVVFGTLERRIRQRRGLLETGS